MPDGIFRPVPDDLFRQAEPEAGEIFELSRRRRRVEFHPDWSYICSPQASAVAVVAALRCCSYDVPSSTWTRVMEVHAPEAAALLKSSSTSFDEWNEGRCPVDVTNQVARLLNEALDNWEVVHLFMYADVMDTIESVLGTSDIRFE